MNSYKELIVWKKSMELVKQIYRLTEKFPKSELFGLTSQMRRSAISIPTNIAEGNLRGTRKDYRHFLITAFGSAGELETHLEIAQMLNYCKNIDLKSTQELLVEILKMLNVMIKKLVPSP